MNKKEFVKEIGAKLDISISESNKIVNTFLETIQETLQKDEKIKFSGFGSWEIKHRKEREMKNPITDKITKVPAKKIVKFKMGKNLSDILNI